MNQLLNQITEVKKKGLVILVVWVIIQLFTKHFKKLIIILLVLSGIVVFWKTEFILNKHGLQIIKREIIYADFKAVKYEKK